MGKISELAWKAFVQTGGVKEYLKYKTLTERIQTEVGEELGAFKDRRDNNKNHQI